MSDQFLRPVERRRMPWTVLVAVFLSIITTVQLFADATIGSVVTMTSSQGSPEIVNQILFGSSMASFAMTLGIIYGWRWVRVGTVALGCVVGLITWSVPYLIVATVVLLVAPHSWRWFDTSGTSGGAGESGRRG